jgi:hypothetical protein
MDEVRKVIEMGYGLMNVFEFWEYEVICFDRSTNSGVLFAEYFNMFLKKETRIIRLPIVC